MARVWLVLSAALAVALGPASASSLARPQAAAAPVVVAVVDTGVQADHPALAGRVLPGWNFIGANADAGDDNGHGTAVAGIVTAAEGTSGIPGACAACRILPVKALAANGTADWGTVSAAVTWAADHGANVINLSLGSPHVPDTIAAAVQYALSKGVIVVAAAGNDGRDESYFPADYPGVVSVAGIDPGAARYGWSNFGGNVTVAAPGCTTATWPGGQYRPDFCGTSAAAPFVAGLAALALSFRPGLTPQEFAAALAQSGGPLADPGIARYGSANAAGLLAAIGVPTEAPSLSRAPELNGAAVVGRTIAASVGWQGAGSVSYEWQRSRDGATWRSIGHARTYVPRATDRGFRLRLVVSAVNLRGAATSASRPSARVVAPRERKTLTQARRRRSARNRQARMRR